MLTCSSSRRSLRVVCVTVCVCRLAVCPCPYMWSLALRQPPGDLRRWRPVRTLGEPVQKRTGCFTSEFGKLHYLVPCLAFCWPEDRWCRCLRNLMCSRSTRREVELSSPRKLKIQKKKVGVTYIRPKRPDPSCKVVCH